MESDKVLSIILKLFYWIVKGVCISTLTAFLVSYFILQIQYNSLEEQSNSERANMLKEWHELPFTYVSIKPKYASLANKDSDSLSLLLRNIHPEFCLHAENRLSYFLFKSGAGNLNYCHSLGIIPNLKDLVFDSHNSCRHIKSARSSFLVSCCLGSIALLSSIFIALGISLLLQFINSQLLTKAVLTSFYFLRVIPLFWICALSVFFLAHPLNGGLFSTPVEFIREDFGIFQYLKGLVLPLLLLMFKPVLFFSIKVYSLIKDESSKPYFLTAKAKGLPKYWIYLKHLMPQVKPGLIELFILIWPSFISGSLIVELSFNISGMGRYFYTQVFEGNAPFIGMMVFLLLFITYIVQRILHLILQQNQTY
jgi:ABC-type dipeptide/oligopeptide/nickel transport system permease component